MTKLPLIAPLRDVIAARSGGAAVRLGAAKARSRIEADIALALALIRATRPLLPLGAFLAAFLLVRRS